MAHITDYGGAIDDYYPARIERIADMELTELEKRADIEAEKSRMKPEALDGGWQPIETAPKDGDILILLRNVVVEAALCDGPDWHSYDLYRYTKDAGHCPVRIDGAEPTHWRPLPEPPK